MSICLERLWGPPSLLSNGYQGSSPGVKRGRKVTLTTHPHLLPKSRWVEAIPPVPQEPPWRVVGQIYFTLLYFTLYPMGTVLFPVVKRPEFETNYSLPLVLKLWMCGYLHPCLTRLHNIIFMQRDIFLLFLFLRVNEDLNICIRQLRAIQTKF
jgi:hypothetical protein